nr:RNA chaperone Hfq [Staphylococcus simulans]
MIIYEIKKYSSQGKNHLIYKHAISTFTQEPSVVE